MYFTVSDFYKTFSKELKLLTENGKMNRLIEDVGIFDYELDPFLKDKYFHSNFNENLLVITTFSTIKDNPFIISDIIKHLIDKKCSGLVIKNVFKLPIQDSIIRYANYNEFPIFLIESQDLFLEKIIYESFKRIDMLKNVRFIQNELDILIVGEPDESDIVNHARQICPSYGEQFFNIYICPKDSSSDSLFEDIYNRFVQSNLNTPGNIVLPYKNGYFFTYTNEKISLTYTDTFCSEIVRQLIPDPQNYNIGISDCHLKLSEYKISLHESMLAASISNNKNALFVKYGDLGIYRLSFTFSKCQDFLHFSDSILKKIIDYDIENSSHLLETIECYIDSECNLDATSQKMEQHKNTIRYRLKKIKEITNLDFSTFSHLEQLSIAIKVRKGIELSSRI